MNAKSAGDVSSQLRSYIEQHELIGKQYVAYLKKVQDRLAKIKKSLGSKPATSADIAKLIADLKVIGREPERMSLSVLLDDLERQLVEMRRDLDLHLGDRLRQACLDAQISFRPLSEGFGVGPFMLSINLAKEQATLIYAKVPVAKDLPLDVATIAAKAKVLKTSIIDIPTDIEAFASQLEEAMAVATIRRGKSLKDQGRVELPVVFREISFIRQSYSCGDGYSIARFVVELKNLLQSERNLEARRQFALETAVLENTKDSRRSIFVPRDAQAGFGEGTYYQALLIKTN